jgi:hypothetical protein
MPTLRIEHSVPDYDGWKRAFDSDPADRRGHNVLRYQVMRSVADPNFVMIDLEFGTHGEAQSLLDAMRGVWEGPGRAVMVNPVARIVDTMEAVELG